MKAVIIQENSNDLPKIEQLAKEAFPPGEYLSPAEILRLAKLGQADFWGLYNESTFVGFMVARQYEDLCFLQFLAISPEARSCGYGTQALKLLYDLYSAKQQVVEIEIIDDSAPNKEQRITRKAFYMRNGFKETGKYVSYFGVDYELLCSTESFDFACYKTMLTHLDLKNFFPIYFED